MEERTPDKKERLIRALDKGMVMIHLDARRPGVIVPAHLQHEAHLLLNLSYRFDPPDLIVNEWGVRSTLTFSRQPFRVAVPWAALYAITSHVTKEFWVYPDDMPPELLERARVVEVAQPARPATPLRDVSYGVPKSVSSSAPESPSEPAPATPETGSDVAGGEGGSGRRRGHLRLVK